MIEGDSGRLRDQRAGMTKSGKPVQDDQRKVSRVHWKQN